MDLTAHNKSNRDFWHAFPDLVITVDDAVADGEKVAFRFTSRGTHQGDLRGIAPTGNRIEIAGMGIAYLSQGKIQTIYEVYDRMGVMQQLGALPPER